MKKDEGFYIDDFEERPYYKCVFHKHPELLKTGPQKKFFRRVKGRPDSLGMAEGPVFECLECGVKYVYSVGKDGDTVMYTPEGQFVRPKWIEEMPESESICGGGADQWSLVWKKGEEPQWEATATMYITWVGGKKGK